MAADGGEMTPCCVPLLHNKKKIANRGDEASMHDLGNLNQARREIKL